MVSYQNHIDARPEADVELEDMMRSSSWSWTAPRSLLEWRKSGQGGRRCRSVRYQRDSRMEGFARRLLTA